MKTTDSNVWVMNRREFLAMTGLSIAGVTFIKLPGNRLLRFGPPAPEWSSRVEKIIPTVCQLCPGACGLCVRTIDGFPVSVAGNRFHPVNQERVCPKGLSALQSFYHPARITAPQIKKNGRFEPTTWEEAFRLIGRELQTIRSSGSPQDVAFLHAGLTGASRAVAENVVTTFGSPNLIGLDGNDGVTLANLFTFGSSEIYAYDLANSNLILSFGAQLLDAWESPLYAQKAVADLRERRPAGQLIQIEPRCSTTASRADRWIPVRPGTEGALALGIAYVLIKENLYDSAFIERHTYGFDSVKDVSGNIRPGFKQLVLERYHPFKVSAITGVSSETIISVAKTLAAVRPAVAVVDRSLTQYTNGVLNVMAVNALNALIGSIERPGGVLKQRKLHTPVFGAVAPDKLALQGLASPRIDGSRSDDPGGASAGLARDFTFENAKTPTRLLLLYNCNPSFYSPFHREFRRWIGRIPLSVGIATAWNETMRDCTLVLPEHHFLERWQDVPASAAMPYSVIGLSQPVVEKPLYDTRHVIDILAGIASAAGEPLAGCLSLPSAAAVIKDYFGGIYQLKRGTVFTDRFESDQIRVLEERGWWSNPHASFDAFWKELVGKGGWWDPAYTYGEWSRVLPTPSHKYEMDSRRLEACLKSHGEDTDNTGVPQYRQSAFSVESPMYPLHLNVYEPISFSQGTGGDVPWLLENPTAPVDVAWDIWVEINPATARELGITDGEMVVVESACGKISAVAKHFEATQPDVVNVPLGLGRKSFSDKIPSIGSNVMEIIQPLRESLAGVPALLSTKVRIYKA